MILQVLCLLHHDMHVHKERVEPKMEHLLLAPQPLVVEELNLDVSTQRHWLRKAELSKCIRPTDVLVHSGREDFCLVQPDDEGWTYM